MLSVERWKRCVVHLEGAADSADKDQRWAAVRVFSEWLLSGEHPSEDEYAKQSQNLRDVRFRGTAIFVTSGHRFYLVTARHVLTDEESARRYYGALSDKYLDGSHRPTIENWIFPIVFRVPSLNEVLRAAPENTAKTPAYLHNLYLEGWDGPYTFSDPSLDLAVISLNKHGQCSRFLTELLAEGYRPISMDHDVKAGPSGEGAEVVAVGYPDNVSVLKHMPLDARTWSWASAAVSLPVFSWGHVAMRHERLPFFWADLTIYPGNSGGPVIDSQLNKLIGIVSGQATVEGTRVPFARVINAGMIHELLESQARKDDEVGKPYIPPEGLPPPPL